MKKTISEIGKLADERPTEPLAGYLAERPQTLQNAIRVWAPCGCCWTYMSAAASVLTQCESMECRACGFKGEVEDFVQATSTMTRLCPKCASEQVHIRAHDFNWEEAQAALDSLQAAEAQEKEAAVGESQEPQLAIVPVPKA